MQIVLRFLVYVQSYRIYYNSQTSTSSCYHNEDIDDINETVELDHVVEGLEEIPNLPCDILQALNIENEGSKPNIEETEVINLADEGEIGVNFLKDMKPELIYSATQRVQRDIFLVLPRYDRVGY